MTRALGLLAAVSLTLAACGKKDETGGTTDSGSTPPTSECGVTAYPEANATDVYYRTTIEFDLQAADSGAGIAVDGVTGTTEVIDTRVVFTPDSPLSQSTTYTATLTRTDCDDVVTSFTTGDIGDPTDAAGLAGKTYSLDLGSGRFVEPPGVGSLIGGLLEDPILLGVTTADASILHVMGALGAGTGQDMCTESFDFPVDADFTENPFFIVQSPSLDLDIQGVQVSIQDMEVSGAFASDASRISGATLKGTLDVSILGDLLGSGSDPCTLLVTFGVECQPCSDGSNTCLSVNVDSMEAAEVSGLTLQTRSSQDIACDSTCGTVTSTTCP